MTSSPSGENYDCSTAANFHWKEKSRQVLIRRGGDEGRRQALSLPRVIATAPQGRYCNAFQGLPPNPKTELNMLQCGPFALLLLLAPPFTPSSQSAVSGGRLVTTYWDTSLSIHLNAMTGRERGRRHFFSPSWLPAFLDSRSGFKSLKATKSSLPRQAFYH